jgi:hypothetical protein
MEILEEGTSLAKYVLTSQAIYLLTLFDVPVEFQQTI